MRNKYEDKVLPKMQFIAKWVESGMTNDELAKCLGIARSSLQSYRNKYPEFRELLDGSKSAADDIIEGSVFATAVGYKKTVSKPMKIKHIEYEDGKKVSEREEIVQVEEELYIPPNPTSQIFWLKNRRPGEWNDKITVESSGKVDVTLTELLKDLNSGDDY